MNVRNKIFFMVLISSFSLNPVLADNIVTFSPKANMENITKVDILSPDLQQVTDLVWEYLIIDKKYWRIKGNYKFNEIIEKQLILLIRESFKWNESYYYELFSTWNRYGSELSLKSVLSSIPKTYSDINISKALFNKSLVSDKLLDASFWVDYNTSYSYNSLIRSIDRKIQDFKRSNGYYPSVNELWELSIYKNRANVKISEILSDFNYNVSEEKINKHDKSIDLKIEQLRNKVKFSLNDIWMKEFETDMKIMRVTSKNGVKALIVKYNKYNSENYNRAYRHITDWIKNIYFSNTSYTLTYKEKLLTLEEALQDIKEVWVSEVTFKDYKKLIWDNEVKWIPEIYKKIPSDSIFFHVNNPEFLFKLLDSRDAYDASWVETLKKIKDLIVDKSGLENFDEIKNNIKHDFIIVFSDIDLVSPNMLIILDKRDKWVLNPWDSPKAAVTIDDHIFIANSKKLLEWYQELDESDSIYKSDDFRYVWMKKQNVKKDVFFFAWDKFFAKLVDFEHFIKMKRKINDYVNLTDLQSFVFAFQKNNWEVLNSFNEINKILEIDAEKLSNYSVKKSIVTHNKIWKISDVLNIDEIDYDLDKITREELESYKSNVLKYKEVWNAYLDPLGIIFSEINDWFKIDFFMTPIQKFGDRDLESMKNIFEGTWIDKLDFLENEKLRIWTIGWILWLDIKQIEEKINLWANDKENNRDLYYLNRGIEEFEKEILDWNNLWSFLWWEFMLSLWWIDHSIFNSYDMEKLDLFFAVEFESKLKAKEMIKLVREKIADEFTGNSRGMENKLYWNLIKPLSEEYNNQSIYIIPNVDLYFVKPSFYYVLLDNYFYISISKSTIRKTIDEYTTWSKSKTKFINNALDWKKIFYAFLDWDSLEKVSDELIESELIIDLYLDIKSWSNFRDTNPLLFQIWKFYRDLEYSKLMSKPRPSFNETFWILELKNVDDIIYLKINRDLLKIENEEIKPELDKILDEIDAKYFEWNGWDISELLELSTKKRSRKLDELFSISLLNMLLDKEYRNSFFTNMSFAFDISDNEIQMQLNSFSSKSNKPSNISKWIDDITDKVKDTFTTDEQWNSNTVLYIIIWILVIIILAGTVVFIRNKFSNKI